jgi:mannose-6-phosphate isomerase-like protein (cupin superfamily)
MAGPSWRRIEMHDMSFVTSPSGLPTQHLVGKDIGSQSLFVAQQGLNPGDRVLYHTHPVDEVLVFLEGSGEARIDDEVVPIGAGISLFLPAEVPHGFQNTGSGRLVVLVLFPGGEFAETRLLEPRG